MIKYHLSISDTANEAASTKDKLAQKLTLDLDDQKQKLRSAEEDLKRTRSETDRYHRTLCSLKEGLQSSLFLTDSALQRSKPRSSRSSPSNRDSDSYGSGKHESKSSRDSANGGRYGGSSASSDDQSAIKEEQDAMDAD